MKSTQLNFSSISKSVSAYNSAVLDAITAYRKETDLDEKTYTASALEERKGLAKNKALASITKAMASFSNSLDEQIAELQKAFSEQYAEVPSDDFIKRLSVYLNFSICPTRDEIEYLIKDSGASPLGLKAINAVLEKTESPLRVATLEDAYRKDIAYLQNISRHPAAPSGDLSGDFARILGVDYTGSLVQSGEFTNFMTGLPTMSERWNKPVPQIVSAQPEPEPKNYNLADSEESIALAKELAEQKQSNFKENMKHYL